MADITPRHRAEKFRRSLNLVERSVPAHLDVHVVLERADEILESLTAYCQHIGGSGN